MGNCGLVATGTDFLLHDHRLAGIITQMQQSGSHRPHSAPPVVTTNHLIGGEGSLESPSGRFLHAHKFLSISEIRGRCASRCIYWEPILTI